jgi:hypothetical protein
VEIIFEAFKGNGIWQSAAKICRLVKKLQPENLSRNAAETEQPLLYY